jgi:DNA-directed RNA polymerase subunit RPC12/RpoP
MGGFLVERLISTYLAVEIDKPLRWCHGVFRNGTIEKGEGMEKGFRMVQCSGCPAKLRFPVSEKDYGTKRTIRCPKCGFEGRVFVPHPAPESTGKGGSHDSSSRKPSPSRDELRELFGGLFGKSDGDLGDLFGKK